MSKKMQTLLFFFNKNILTYITIATAREYWQIDKTSTIFDYLLDLGGIVDLQSVTVKIKIKFKGVQSMWNKNHMVLWSHIPNLGVTLNNCLSC